jgi:hypothetical protein
MNLRAFYLLIAVLTALVVVILQLTVSDEMPPTPRDNRLAVRPDQVSRILSQRTPRPLSDPMILPANYRETFVHYATVDRIDGISRNLYISPAAIMALENGDPIPERTQIIIEAYTALRDEEGKIVVDEDGHFIQDVLDPEIHSSEFRTSWQLADMHTTSRAGDWNFMAFQFETGEQVIHDIGGCFSCHEAAVRRDFVFTRPLLLAYAETGEVQYTYCPAPDRVICR